MKSSIILTAILGLTNQALAAPASSGNTPALQARQTNWSFAPFREASCLGLGTTFFGTGSSRCTNIGFDARAVTAISAKCTIVAFVIEGCPGGVGTSYGPGTSQCFTNTPNYKSFRVDC